MTQEQRKEDFDYIMSVLEVEPEHDVHKLFMALTQKGKQSMITILNMDKSGLKDLKATDTDGSILAFDDWEVSKIINVNRCAAHLQAEKGEDFRVKGIDLALFEDFKLSPACTQVQYAQGDINRTPPSSLSSSHSPNMQQNRSFTLAESFRKGIKRDSTIFNTFEDGK